MLAGVLLLAGHLVDHAGMQVLEDRVPIGPGEPVDRGKGAMGIARPRHGPGGEQGGGEIGDRPAHRLREVAPRGAVLALLEGVHAEHQAGNAVVLVDLGDALGVFGRLVDVAVDQQRQEGAVEQFAVTGVAAQRVAVEGGGSGGIALLPSMARREIGAGCRHAGELALGRHLPRGGCRRHGEKRGKRGANHAPGKA